MRGRAGRAVRIVAFGLCAGMRALRLPALPGRPISFSDGNPSHAEVRFGQSYSVDQTARSKKIDT
jgi:hypothetical protein